MNETYYDDLFRGATNDALMMRALAWLLRDARAGKSGQDPYAEALALELTRRAEVNREV